MDLTTRHLDVLERFRPRHRADGTEMRLPLTIPNARDEQLGREMEVGGLLTSRRQTRKGFPRLYTITDAGVAQLPSEGVERTVSPEILAGPISPPRG